MLWYAFRQRLESLLRPMVYDSPVEAPMFEHLRFLMPIYNAKTNQERIDRTLRYLRTQFQENIAERLVRFPRYFTNLYILTAFISFLLKRKKTNYGATVSFCGFGF